MAAGTKNGFHTETLKKTIRVKASKDTVWRKLSNIAGLSSWVVDIKDTIYLSKKRKGVGAIRLITFADGNEIEEHVVAWENGEYFTYVATEGLPLRAYVATISVRSKSRNLTEVTWQSYLNSKKMPEKEFLDFIIYLGAFYAASLENLKRQLEG